MSDDLFYRIINQVEDAYPNLEAIGFHFFGEIELKKNFHNLICWAREKLPDTQFGISTTLTSQNKEVVKNLLLSGFNGIGIWPDGFSEESYFRFIPGSSFELVKNNILFLLKEREKMKKTDIGIGVG